MTAPAANGGSLVPVPPDEWIRALPKVELHCHLEGAMRPSTVADLAHRHGVAMPVADPTELYRFRRDPRRARGRCTRRLRRPRLHRVPRARRRQARKAPRTRWRWWSWPLVAIATCSSASAVTTSRTASTGFTAADLVAIARDGIDACWLDDDTRRSLSDRLDAWWQANP